MSQYVAHRTIAVLWGAAIVVQRNGDGEAIAMRCSWDRSLSNRDSDLEVRWGEHFNIKWNFLGLQNDVSLYAPKTGTSDMFEAQSSGCDAQLIRILELSRLHAVAIALWRLLHEPLLTGDNVSFIPSKFLLQASASAPQTYAKSHFCYTVLEGLLARLEGEWSLLSLHCPYAELRGLHRGSETR